MENINMSRVILGGIVAGIVGDILGSLVDGVMLGPQWAAAMKALGRPEFSMNQIIGFNIIGLGYGIFAIWLYAAIRNRYGAGPKTAVYVGVMTWVIGTLLPNAALMGVSGLFPSNLTVTTTACGVVESVMAVLAGAALYKEATAAPHATPATA